MDGFDPVTGEITEPRPALSELAMQAGRDERRERRAETLGVGQVAIYRALAKAYAEIGAVIGHNKLADKKSGQRGDYTSYDAIVAKVRPILLRNGIIFKHRAGHVFQLGEGSAKTAWLPVATDLVDIESGSVLTCEIPVPVPQQNPHALGAAFSYGKRYSLLGVLGIATGDATEDDDAQSAMPRTMEVESEVESLKRELLENATEAEAVKWKAAVHKRLQDLEADDFEAVKVAFQDHVKSIRAKIASGEVPAPKPSKPTRGGSKERIAATHNDGGTA